MFKIRPLKKIRASLEIGGDKSISHRAIILSSISQGKTEIRNFLHSEDTLTTLQAFQNLGVNIKYNKFQKKVSVESKGKYLNSENITLQMKNSGTTIRLISGVLSAQKFSSTLQAYSSLKRRPMLRITQPLRQMGADIKGRKKEIEEYPPLKINPVDFLKGIEYRLSMPSAQVKSCLLLAGLFAQGKTSIVEPYRSRDHTERMLKIFGAKIRANRRLIFIEDSQLQGPSEIFIPSDFSSASFFIALATLTKGARLLLKKVSINPTRLGFLKVLRRMGAKIRFININKNYFEPYADILVEYCQLRGTKIKEREVPLMIDELPLLFVLACLAKGKTQILGLKELKVKETDRIKSMEYNLKKMGAKFSVKEYLNPQKEKDWRVEIEGPAKFKDSSIKSFSDHRTAMSLIIGRLSLGREAVIDDITCIDKSFPEFLTTLRRLDK
ncbi:MAG: 3-phosphoshikimate 1-carboxyvinyltransferase [Candidatus Omnitrophica bacterium]|nr:3-phosphoshikimate 1-carboxyvinyltransferase [Candidatus Omnitrophota bacterium]